METNCKTKALNLILLCRCRGGLKFDDFASIMIHVLSRLDGLWSCEPSGDPIMMENQIPHPIPPILFFGGCPPILCILPGSLRWETG